MLVGLGKFKQYKIGNNSEKYTSLSPLTQSSILPILELATWLGFFFFFCILSSILYVCACVQERRFLKDLKYLENWRKANANILCLNQRRWDVKYSFLFCFGFWFPGCTAKRKSLRDGVYLLREGDLPSFKGKKPPFWRVTFLIN